MLRIIGLAGVLFFGTAFWFTYSFPGGVEDIAKKFIKERIEKETKEKIESLTFAAKDTKLGAIAQKLVKGQEAKIAQFKAKLQEKAYEKMADIIAKMRNPSCECRKNYAQHLKYNLEFKIASLQSANEKLMAFMKSKYMEVANKLTWDLRIFTGSNLVVFLLLLLTSVLKSKATAHLFFPSLLLATSTIVCSYFYLFEQNWFFTIIYNDYLGFGYLAYLGVLFALLCDIVFNRARITTEIINAFLNIIGQAATVVPC